MAEIPQPIIIKKIKKGGGGHHGGAWKVAYADFVTAMMAFFLLLWLLSTTTPEQKLGIAEYFTPTIGLKDSMGIGFKGGLTASNVPGMAKMDSAQPNLVAGQIKQGTSPDSPNDQQGKANPDADAAAQPKKSEEISEDQEQMDAAEQNITQALEQDELKDYKNDIIVQNTPDGLKIDMIDDQKKPMFVPGGAQLTDMGKKVLDSMARIIIKSPNNIAINGHTDAATQAANPQYTNWELSADRALATRRFLSTTQLEPERVAKVSGFADHELLSPQEPTSPRNRRVTIILLRGSYFRDPKTMPTTRGLLSVPSMGSPPHVIAPTSPKDKISDAAPGGNDAIFASRRH